MPARIDWRPETRDAVVIGASYPGLITAALLQQAGLSTVVVDPLDMVGQPGGAYPYGDYWISYSHRDGVGCRQALYGGSTFNFEALKRLGLELPLVGPFDPALICHAPPAEELAIHRGSDPDATKTVARYVMGLPEEDIDAFIGALRTLGQMSREAAQKLIPVTFGEWLPGSGLSAAAQRTLLTYCTMIWSMPPEITSVGRFIINHLHIPQPHYFLSNPDAPANQGMIVPFADRLTALGGEIWLHQKPLEILLEDGRVAGLRMRNPNAFVREVRAPVVVHAYVAYKVFDLIDQDRFPGDYVRQAFSTKPYELPLMVLNMGLSELPRRRSDGQPDTRQGFHRVMRAPDRRYGGGWRILSNCHPCAPAGKHLLAVYYAGGLPFEESMAELKLTADYVRGYYADFDAIVDWAEYQWIPEAHSQGWMYKTGERISQRSPIPGLYFSGYTTDTEGQDYDADACGALRAADMILADRGAAAR